MTATVLKNGQSESDVVGVQLLTHLLSTGYTMTVEEFATIIDYWFRENFWGEDVREERMALQVRQGEGFRAFAPTDVCNPLQELKINGIVHIPRSLADFVFKHMLRDKQLLSQPDDIYEHLHPKSTVEECLKTDSTIWELLVELEQESALPYSLQVVAEAVTAEFERDEQQKAAKESL